MILNYNITQTGRQALRSFIATNRPIMPRLALGTELIETQVWPLEIQILEDFAGGDHSMDMKEITDRYGFKGTEVFKELHKAGYFSAEEA